QAQTSYTIPLKGGAWDHTKITVQAPTSPTWAYDKVLEAMQDWNDAQNWFRKTYLTPTSAIYQLTPTSAIYQLTPTSAIYQLTPIQSTPDVTVQFTNGFLFVGGGEYGGYTTDRISASVMTSATVTLSLYSTAPYIERIAVHEFGHVLGLGHFENVNDVMNP